MLRFGQLGLRKIPQKMPERNSVGEFQDEIRSSF
jgi:hypothetical protein